MTPSLSSLIKAEALKQHPDLSENTGAKVRRAVWFNACAWILEEIEAGRITINDKQTTTT